MKKAAAIVLFFVVCGKLFSQPHPVFYTLNTANGLSYIGVNGICADTKGNLWIATGNGLNVFNGRTTEKYYSSEYPQLQSNNITSITCDTNNRVWMTTAGGYVTMLDEKRKLHKVTLRNENKPVKTFSILQTPSGNIYLYADKGMYQFDGKSGLNNLDSLDNSQFRFLPLIGYEKFRYMGGNSAFSFDENSYLLVFRDGVLKVNYKTNTIESRLDIAQAHALATWGKDELLYYDVGESQLKLINLATMKISYPLKGLKDQLGKEVTATINEAKPVNNHQFLLTTQNQGIYIWDTAAKKIFNYKHSVFDPTSICNNTQTYIAVGKKGWIFISCNPSGVSYFKLNEVVHNQYMFTAADGQGYDGYIAGIATKDNDTYYIGTSSGMLEWKRSTNTTSFIDFSGPDGKSIFNDFEVYSVAIDDNGNIWATVKDGLIVFNKRKKLLKHFRKEDGSLKQRAVARIILGPDGFVWACGRDGMCRINAKTFEVDNLENTPLKQFDSSYVALPLFTDKDNLWLFVDKTGIYHYSLSTKKLEELEGFKKYKNTEGAFDFGVDKTGNVYLGNTHGLKIFFKDGREKIITRKDGLLIDRVEGFLFDKHNRLWIGNDIGLVCYDPADSSIKTFDERYGLSIYGFRVGSYFQMPDGEFVFGTPRGLQYFHPDSLYDKQVGLNVSVSKIETKNISSTVTDNAEFKLAAKDNQVTFYFGSIDFAPHVRTYYEYKLADLDKDWTKLADQNSVRYNSLPPGKYVFKVRISNDNKNWQDADNEVTVIIAAPFYQTWWFRLLGIFAGVLIVWYVLKYYQHKQQQQKEELETQVVINYFASEINGRYRTDELLQDVAKNLIGKLGFEECMIYLWNDDQTVLVQKAGYGSKGSMQGRTDKINYDIARGKGIVGAAVETKQNLLVNDTSKDKRYFTADGKIMLSELCVPLVHDNEVLGAINIEHHQKNYFTAKHLKILSTIAVLCANQLQRIRAEEEKQQARIEALQNKEKAQREELEAQIVINFFASQINKHHNIDSMLWDIAKNCISRLNFEDCVIYLIDEERNVLEQKAAYGPKMERDFAIYQPIEIPLGRGIVGSVAQTGKPELIGNTESDERYIADDARRFSELAVPLIIGGKVIGVIDSEHSQKNFFNQKHLNMLNTIAVLCATHIQRVKAEEEKQKAKIEALENRQKVTESRLQSLRLQMNPHFLFNALNSIQQMILANEEMVATRYLSKFSKLLRTILVHSDREYVTLKEELEILNLYIDLESIRFKQSFRYNIECDDEIDADEIRLPTLLIQPFVENAIWHGLMHKEGERVLQVKFSEVNETIHCVIEDNGIGREKSREAKLATGQGNKHTSKGIQVSLERLKAMSNGNGKQGSLEIFDLKDEKGEAAGTRVEIIFPIQNN